MSMDSTGARNMSIVAGLGGSKLEAKGGIVVATLPYRSYRHQVRLKAGMLRSSG